MFKTFCNIAVCLSIPNVRSDGILKISGQKHTLTLLLRKTSYMKEGRPKHTDAFSSLSVYSQHTKLRYIENQRAASKSIFSLSPTACRRTLKLQFTVTQYRKITDAKKLYSPCVQRFYGPDKGGGGGNEKERKRLPSSGTVLRNSNSIGPCNESSVQPRTTFLSYF